MLYYVEEHLTGEENRLLGGTKARADIETILSELGAAPIFVGYDKNNLEKNSTQKIKRHIDVKKSWDDMFSSLKKGDTVFIQYVILEHSIFLYRTIKKARKNNIKIVFIVHDLESLQFMDRASSSRRKIMRVRLEENCLKYGERIIVHNNRMKKILVQRGYAEEKQISLGIFDYLIDDYDAERMKSRKLSPDLPVIISGNLSREKSGYVYDLPDSVDFNLYGVNYNGEENPNVSYKGAYEPEEVPYVMNGSFGLVWDGESSESCVGSFGRYLKINNPHKTSLYLASGIPVAIWRKAALAGFIMKNKCGVVIDSIEDLAAIRNNMTVDQYEQLRKNAEKISKKLRTGYYLKKAVKRCLEER